MNTDRTSSGNKRESSSGLYMWVEEGNSFQRWKKCLDEGVHEPRIEHYLLRSSSGRLVEVQWRVEHQRPQDISTPATVEGGPGTLAPKCGPHADGEQHGQTKQTKKETCSGQKPKVRWPGASEVKEWNCINVDLSCCSGSIRAVVGYRQTGHVLL